MTTEPFLCPATSNRQRRLFPTSLEVRNFTGFVFI